MKGFPESCAKHPYRARRGPAAALIAAALTACSQPPAGPGPDGILEPRSFSGSHALAEALDLVALGPRHAGTPGAERAARHLAARLKRLGLHPVVDAFSDPTPEGPATFRNVTTLIRGASRELVVLVSHYDTKSGISEDFAGANDSGSSTGLLLELARLLAAAPPLPYDVLLAFVDGEECKVSYGPRDGLHGSRRLVRQIEEVQHTEAVLAAIVVDMVGDPDLTVTIPRNSSAELVAMAFEAARAEGARHRFTLARTSILDDHVPFRRAGIPAIDLIDFEFGSAPGLNDYWHTPRDTADRLSAQSLELVGRIVVRMLNSLASAPYP